MKLLDINGRDASGQLTGLPDGKITADDRTILATHSRSTRSGKTASSGWRAFSVNYLLRGVQGVKS